MNLDSMQEILDAARKDGKPMWLVVMEADMEQRGVTREQSMDKMRQAWHAMMDAADNYDGSRRSRSGLVGGQGQKMKEYAKRGKTIGGDFTAQVMAEALAMGESNACMRRIVAAPTAGSCGTMPAVLLPLWRRPQREPAASCLRFWFPFSARVSIPRNRCSRPCLWPAALAPWLPTAPVSPVPPAAVRLRSALPPPWRRARW